MYTSLMFLASFWHSAPTLSYIAKPTHTRDVVNSWHIQAHAILNQPHHVGWVVWNEQHSNTSFFNSCPIFPDIVLIKSITSVPASFPTVQTSLGWLYPSCIHSGERIVKNRLYVYPSKGDLTNSEPCALRWTVQLLHHPACSSSMRNVMYSWIPFKNTVAKPVHGPYNKDVIYIS